MDEGMSRGLRKLGTLAMVVLSTAVAALVAEVVVRFVVNPGDFLHATVIEDPILNHRIKPNTTGHDALGFRNRELPAHAEIVAIGDSMTYGTGVPRDANWPQQLAGQLGEPVYNMGLGGYGPLQYLHLAQTAAKELRPRLMIVGFNFGNDMMDAFYLARGLPHWYGWRVSIEKELSETDYDRAGQAEPTKRLKWLRDWLSRNSVLYSMLRVTVLPGLQAREQDGMARQVGADAWMLWHDSSNPAVRTIFTPRLRLLAIDLGLQPVREGMQIAQKALVALKTEADRHGSHLLIVLIPTKERAYCRYLRKSGDSMSQAFVKLCDAEGRASAVLTQFLSAQGMAYVDVTSALESHIDKHLQPYPTHADGHPQAAGYAVIAQEVAAAVRQQLPRK